MSSKRSRINIGGDPNDPTYRYWMPPLKTKIEGRGNGIKTVVTNISAISNKLQTQPLYISKFFGIEVGAVSNFDKHRNVGIVNGTHSSKEFQKLLTKFINEFILCRKCGLPELKTRVSQKQILQKCKSCANKGFNKSTHKVSKEIIKYASSRKKPVSNKKKTSEKIQPQSSNINEEKKCDEILNEMWTEDTKMDESAHIRQQEMNRLAMKAQDNICEERKTQDLNTDASGAAILRKYVQFLYNKSQYELVNEINIITTAKRFNQKDKLVFVLEALCSFDSLENFISCIQKYKLIFQALTENQNDVQLFLGVVQEFVCKRDLPTDFMNKFYKVLECLYDEEICDENDLILWFDMSLDKALFVSRDEAEGIKDKSNVFVEWLRRNDHDCLEGESKQGMNNDNL